MKTTREDIVQVFILIAVAGMAAAASFTHVHDWTMHNAPPGTGSWFGWANAVISELTPTAAGIEIRRRRRSDPHARIAYPMAILVAAAVLSLSAQVAEARPTIGGWISSAVPALAFLALTKLVLSRSGHTPKESPEPALTHHEADNRSEPQSVTLAVPSTEAPEPAKEPDPVPAVLPALAPVGVPNDGHALEPVPSAQLLMSARMNALSHERMTGDPITPVELADRLGIPATLAEAILDRISAPALVTTINGTAANGSRP